MTGYLVEPCALFDGRFAAIVPLTFGRARIVGDVRTGVRNLRRRLLIR